MQTKDTLSIKAKIHFSHSMCEKLNPHFSAAQTSDWVFQRVFGEYKGTELDKRNMALCK